jgi:hypothetical protein
MKDYRFYLEGTNGKGAMLAHNLTGGPAEMRKERLTSSVISMEPPPCAIPPMLAFKRSPLQGTAKGKLNARSALLAVVNAWRDKNLTDGRLRSRPPNNLYDS